MRKGQRLAGKRRLIGGNHNLCYCASGDSSERRPATGRNSGTINFLKGRSTSILRSTLLISERLLASAQAVDESSAQLRYGQEWKAWVQLEKAGLSLTGVEQMVRDLRDAVRRYQDEVADAAIAARSVRDAEEWGHE